MKLITQIIRFLLVATLLLSPLPLAKNAFAQENKPNPIDWGTQYARLTSSNFYIRIGNKYFFGQNPQIHSDPGNSRTTLEVIWTENDVEMRLFMYFRKTEQNEWEMYEMRTYNGERSGDWIYYRDSLNNQVSSLIGYHNYQERRTFIPTDSSEGRDAEVFCQECSINAFMPKSLPLFTSGYSLDIPLGLTEGEVITISNQPQTGYGVNVLLKDASGAVVSDQRSVIYEWRNDNPKVISLNSWPLCLEGIIEPCPLLHIDITGISPGVTLVTAYAKRASDDRILASGSFPVVVKEYAKPSPSPQENISNQDSGLRQELIKLQESVGLISQKVEGQEQEIGTLRKILNSISHFLESSVGKVFK